VPAEEMPEKINRIAAELGIENMLQKPVHHLSGGQQQLLCVASVLVMQPDWLIFDEPTSHLDPWSRRKFWGILKHLKASKEVGIIVISQISDDFDYFDEIKVFSQGDIIFSGSPTELKQQVKLKEIVHFPEKWKYEELQN
jgi:energy-coupling factor transporter ATP-binding protein EcfA2